MMSERFLPWMDWGDAATLLDASQHAAAMERWTLAGVCAAARRLRRCPALFPCVSYACR